MSVFLYPCILAFRQQHINTNDNNSPKLPKLDAVEAYKWLSKCLLFLKSSMSLTSWCDDGRWNYKKHEVHVLHFEEHLMTHQFCGCKIQANDMIIFSNYSDTADFIED